MYIAALSHTSLRDRAVTSSVVEYCTEYLRNARLDPVLVAIPDDTTLHTVDRILARSAFVLNHGLIVYYRLHCSWLPSLVGILAYLCSCWCDEQTHRFVLPHAMMHLAFAWQWCRVASQLSAYRA